MFLSLYDEWEVTPFKNKHDLTNFRVISKLICMRVLAYEFWSIVTRSLSVYIDSGQHQNGGEFNCRAKDFELCRKMQQSASVLSIDAKVFQANIVWILQKYPAFINKVRKLIVSNVIRNFQPRLVLTPHLGYLVPQVLLAFSLIKFYRKNAVETLVRSIMLEV